MTLERFVANTLRTGAVASAATTVAVAAFGESETGQSAAPLNAISHIVWGDKAAEQDEVTLKYTGAGLFLNTAAVTSWAALHELFFGRTADKGDIVGTLLGGAAVSAIAYVTDYHVVPDRLTPGFEKRLPNRSLLGVYSVLALGLAIGSLCRFGGEHTAD